jgi:hypothetical protein
VRQVRLIHGNDTDGNTRAQTLRDAGHDVGFEVSDSSPGSFRTIDATWSGLRFTRRER